LRGVFVEGNNNEKSVMTPLIDLLASSPGFFISACLIFGLLIGSFLNVVIYRVPIILERQWREQCLELAAEDARATTTEDASVSAASESAPPPEPFNLVVPRSTCPACKAPITALQNIPILSYLFLKGRCASCGIRISPRYPAIEALTGLLSAAVAWKFGFGWPALAALTLTWFLIALTFIDVDHQLLPDSLTLPLLWIGLLLSLWASDSTAPIPVEPAASITGAIAGYLSLWSVYHLFRLTTGKEGMGYGDFKLFAALGAWLGWKMLFPVILIAAGCGAVVGIAIHVLRGHKSSMPFAFGPFLAAAGWLTLMFGRELLTRYFGF
jgi:leader peptidase (prepilin peptidase) / N-methyltransferase